MRPDGRDAPFVPTEFRVSMAKDDKGAIGVLTVKTTNGQLDFALAGDAAGALVKAASQLQSKLDKAR